jgi:hypothetical protein
VAVQIQGWRRSVEISLIDNRKTVRAYREESTLRDDAEKNGPPVWLPDFFRELVFLRRHVGGNVGVGDGFGCVGKGSLVFRFACGAYEGA